MTVTQDTIPAQWLRAMQRAEAAKLKAFRINATTYTVRSVSHPGTGHLIGVSLAGKVTSCDCKGFEHGHICCHMGATARRLLRERAITIRQPVPKKERSTVEKTVREPCARCGLTANLDPSLHHERYGHIPEVMRDGQLHRFDYSTYTFQPAQEEEEPASEPVQAVESGCRGKSQIFQEEEVA